MKNVALTKGLGRWTALLAISTSLVIYLGCSTADSGSGADSTPSPDDDGTASDDDVAGDDDDNDNDNDITPADADDDDWQISEALAGLNAAYLIDEAGAQHVAYQRNDDLYLLYGTDRAGAWTFEHVSPEGYRPALVVDAAGEAHIVASATNEIFYATNASGAWHSAELETGLDVSDTYSVAVDGNGHPEIALAWSGSAGEDNVAQEIRFARFESGEWSESVWLRSENCTYLGYQFVDLAFAGTGDRSFAYYDFKRGGLRATTKDGEFSEPSGSEHGQKGSLAVDATGATHMAYDGFENWLRYETNAGGGWRGEYMVNFGSLDGFRTAVAADANGAAHIAYTHTENGNPLLYDLRYVTNVSGQWIYSIIDDFGTAWPMSNLNIAVDPEGYVHIVYHKYAETPEDGATYHAVSPEPYGAPK